MNMWISSNQISLVHINFRETWFIFSNLVNMSTHQYCFHGIALSFVNKETVLNRIHLYTPFIVFYTTDVFRWPYFVFSILHCSSSVGHNGEGTNASSPRRLSHQNSEGQVMLMAGEPCEHTIDCGDIVWGLAFGSSVPEKQSRCVNIEWHRFKFGQDQLLLATGLNNGRIKIWDVYTGKNTSKHATSLNSWPSFPYLA